MAIVPLRRSRDESVASNELPGHPLKRLKQSINVNDRDDAHDLDQASSRASTEPGLDAEDDSMNEPVSTVADLANTQAHFEAVCQSNAADDARFETHAEEEVQRELQRHVENQERQNGIVESVECINFMCHEHLTITLGPLINFIVGHNGSGKSAVLTALTLCLGGKATATNRGQSLKNFVKEGKEHAILIVKVKNQGQSGYRTDTYGKSIIVERYFSISGASSFKIKSESGKIISTKRAELDELCDFYAFQLDNPVNVLTQDLAREFLNNSTPNDKYKFVIKGVQLDQLNQDYNMMFTLLQDTASQLELVQETCDSLKKTYNEASERFNALREYDTLHEKKRKYDRMHAWAQVGDTEKTLLRLQEKAAAWAIKLQQKKEDEAAAVSLLLEKEQSKEAAVQSVHTARGDLEPLEITLDRLKEEASTIQYEMRDVQSNQRTIHASQATNKKNLARIQQEIRAEETRLAALDDGSTAKLMQAVTAAEEEFDAAQRELEAHPGRETVLKSDENTAKLRYQDLQNALREKQEQVDIASRRLQDLRTGAQDPLNAYHPSLRQLQRLIAQEKRFKGKPVGPMGMYIKVVEAEYAALLEAFLSSVLTYFVVTSKHDERILSELLKRSNFRASILIGSSIPIVPRGEPDPSHMTILRATKRIEEWVVVKQRGQAIELVDGGRVKRVLCFQDGSKVNGHIIQAQPNGGRKMDGLTQRNPGQSKLIVDQSSQIRFQESLVTTLKTELHDLELRCRELRNAHEKTTQALAQHNRKHRELREKKQRAAMNLDDAKAERDKATNMDSPLDSLKDELNVLKEEADQLASQYRLSQEALDTLSKENQGHTHLIAGALEEVMKKNKEIARLEKGVNKADDARVHQLYARNEIARELEDLEREKRVADINATNAVRTVEEHTQMAARICPRVPVDEGETGQTLDDKLDGIRRQISAAENKAGGTREQVSQQVRKANKIWQETRKRFRDLNEIKDAMHISLMERTRVWRLFRNGIVARARIQFQYLLSERGFHGELLFDHQSRELALKVEPNIRQGSKQGRETKTLSGGEKSFSTICLLLAMWDAMGSPIRCLDEFDVFMDSINRDISMNMMISAARRSVGRQFILITPQSMSSVLRNNAPDVKVIQMRPPERGQQALVAE